MHRLRAACVTTLLSAIALSATMSAGPANAVPGSDDGVWTHPFQTPGARDIGVAAYDPVSGLTLTADDDLWAIDPGDGHAWLPLLPPGSGPEGDPTVLRGVFDEAGSRILAVLSPYYPDPVEVWELPFEEPLVWRKLTSTGSTPSYNVGFSIVFDAPANRIVYFGGTVNPPFGGPPTYTNTVWTVDLPPGTAVWTRHTLSGAPPPRTSHEAVFNPIDRSMLVFGGAQGSTLSNELWKLDLATLTWQQVSTVDPPPPRAGERLLYDAIRERVLLVGGYDGTYTSEVWALPMNPPTWTWTLLATSGQEPWPRLDMGVVHDTARDELVYFAGGGNDIWTLALEPDLEWTPRLMMPTARSDAGLLHEPAGHSMVMVGDWPTDPFWRLRVGGTPEWERIAPEGPTPVGRNRTAVTFDPLRNAMWMFGGLALTPGSSVLGDLWRLDLGDPPGWTEVTPPEPAPGPRHSQRAAYDPSRNCLWVFGGKTDELWRLSLDEPVSWSPVAPGGLQPGISMPLAVACDAANDRLLVVGSGPAVWALPLAAPSGWTNITPPPPGWPPLSMSGYDPILDRFVFVSSLYYTPVQVWALEDVAGSPAWRQVSVSGDPPPQSTSGTQMAFDPEHGRFTLFGGSGSNETTFLELGRRITPGAALLSADVPWSSGAPIALTYQVDSPIAAPRAVEWAIDVDRDWPGLPLRGLLQVGSLGMESLGVVVQVPDTAASGTVTARLRAWYAGAYGCDTTRTDLLPGATTSVAGGPTGPALAIDGPHPARGRLRLSVTLPDGRPATLELFDAAGRRAARRTIEGAGRHVVPVGATGSLAPGVYVAKLEHAAGRLTLRLVVLR